MDSSNSSPNHHQLQLSTACTAQWLKNETLQAHICGLRVPVYLKDSVNSYVTKKKKKKLDVEIILKRAHTPKRITCGSPNAVDGNAMWNTADGI